MPVRSLLLPVLLAVLVFALGSIAGCSRHSSSGGTSVRQSPGIPSTSVRFVDVTQSAGINYRWVVAGRRPLDVLQTIGNGCAFLDYDNSGNLSILLVGPKLALYKGDGHGRFTDVTHQMGLDQIHGNFLGCAVADYDNDGYDDIYLTAYRGGVLLHNERGMGFKDVTKEAGIAPQPWGTSAGWADIDGTGRLSLYIGNYAVFDSKTKPQLCPAGKLMTACGPRYYTPLHGALFLNVGGGKFRDVTTQWNAEVNSGRILGVAFADFDGSGRQSLYLANDEIAGDLLQNTGSRFNNIGGSSGTAYDANGNKHGGMGTDWGDYDNDGRLDLAVGTFQKEDKCVYHNDGSDLFTEQSVMLGIAKPALPNVSFGTKWLDADNDGWLDLMFANGHVEDNVDQIEKNESYREPTQFFYNNQGKRFTDISGALVGKADRPIVGRGLAIGDFDNDGRIDALVVDSEGAPLLLHNETQNSGHWLEVTLVGTRDNRDGLGSLITVEAGGLKQVRLCQTDGSYMSASAKRVHIGLGSAATAATLSVRWPSGHVDMFKNVAADHMITLKEGDAAPVSVR